MKETEKKRKEKNARRQMTTIDNAHHFLKIVVNRKAGNLKTFPQARNTREENISIGPTVTTS